MHNLLKKFSFFSSQGTLGRVKWGFGLRELGLATVLAGSATAASAQMPSMPMPMPPPSMPAVAGPLSVNPNPLTLDLGPLGNKVYVTGALTGIGYAQDHATGFSLFDDNDAGFDLTNAQVFVQKTDGLFQYYIQAGAYSLPTLGFPFLKSSVAMNQLWGVVPQAYVKFAITDTFSVQVGKLPTLIGDEYSFTFENMNIMRGLLWGEEPAVSRGLQVNYTVGPVAMSVSWNDGYYSDRYNWVSGLVAWTINPKNTLAFAGGGNIGSTGFKSTVFQTPFLQNNGYILNLIYTYNAAPLVISPYVQYQHVPENDSIGIFDDASSWAFAVLANYSFNANFKLAGRIEYITTSGDNSILFGPGSNAWSFTITPTYQYNQFFARIEYAFVTIGKGTPGYMIGPGFDASSQNRGMVEVGILF